MRHFLIVLLACFCIVSCCQPVIFPSSHTAAPVDPHLSALTISVYVDRDFIADERFEIDSALSDWNDSLNGYIHLQVKQYVEVSQEIVDQVKMEELAWLIIEGDNPDPESSTIAHVESIPGHLMYVYRNRWQHTDRKVIIIHEAGHLLGLHHSDHLGSIMSGHGYVTQGKCIDQWMIKELLEEHYWMKLEYLNFCTIK